MNDDLDEPQFEHEEPLQQPARKKKKDKKKRARDDDDDDDAAPAAPAILEEDSSDDGDDGGSAGEVEDDAPAVTPAAASKAPAAASEAPAPAAKPTAAGGPAKKQRKRPPLAAPRDGAAWAAWLRDLAPDAPVDALPARCVAPREGLVEAVAARVRGGRGRAVDVVVVCTSAKRAADLAKALRDHAKIRRAFKLFGKHKDRKEQERALATLSPLPRVAVATPARLEALRGKVPWAPSAALLINGAPDAKGYTPFTQADAKGALALTVAALLENTDVVFGVVS